MKTRGVTQYFYPGLSLDKSEDLGEGEWTKF